MGNRPSKTDSTRRRILIVAYACNPWQGSEHGVGWGWVKMIAQNHEAHVITAEFERQDIERWLVEHPESRERMKFHYPRHKPWHHDKRSRLWRAIEHSPAKPIMNYAYRLWQRDAFRLAADLHREHRFDLYHLVTYVGFRFPGRFWELDCPFVWGPIGGLENTPCRFLRLLGPYGAAYYAARNVLNDIDRRFLPGPKRAFAKASASGAVIAATPRIRELIQRFYGVDSRVVCEVCPPDEIASDITLRAPGEPLRLCWVGEHLPGKALQLLLYALAELPGDVDWRLNVLGDGPLRRKWMRLAEKLRIQDRCFWHGKIPRSEAVPMIHCAHVFVITSLKDLTSTVLLEAIFQGTPVICPDHCGFSHVVTQECGIKLPITNIDQFVGQLSESIDRLAQDESLRRNLAAGARRRAQDFDLSSKTREIDELYRHVLRCAR